MGSKIAAVIVGILLAIVAVSHYNAGEHGLLTIDALVAYVCWRLWWQPQHRESDSD